MNGKQRERDQRQGETPEPAGPPEPRRTATETGHDIIGMFKPCAGRAVGRQAGISREKRGSAEGGDADDGYKNVDHSRRTAHLCLNCPDVDVQSVTVRSTGANRRTRT